MATNGQGAGRPAKGPRARGTGPPIPVDTKEQAELLARWVETKYSWVSDALAREKAWRNAHPNDKESAGRVPYYEHLLGFVSQLVWFLRAHKVRGPVDDENT